MRSLPLTRRTASVACALAVALVVAGCSGGDGQVDTSAGTTRFLAGDGTGTFYEKGKRPLAPVLEGSDLEGKPLSTAGYAGQPYVVNVWGSWCAPCKKEQPDLERFASEARADGIGFVGINVRDSGTAAPLAHVRRYKVSYPSFFNPSASLVTKYKEVPPAAIPSTLVIDAEGRIAARVIGPVDYETLRDVTARVAKEPA